MVVYVFFYTCTSPTKATGEFYYITLNSLKSYKSFKKATGEFYYIKLHS